MDILNKIFPSKNGNTRTVAVKKNVIYSLLLKGISIIVSFALVPLTIGYVSSDLYGVWLTISSIQAWITFLDVGFSQGLKNKLTEAIAKDQWEKGRKLVSTTYLLMVLIFVPTCIVIELLIPFINWCNLLNVSSLHSENIKYALHIMVFLCSVQMIVNVLVSVIAAFQKVALSNSFIVIGNILALIIIAIIRNTTPPSLVSLCFSLGLMPLVVTIIASFYFYCKDFKRISPSFHHVDLSLTKDLWNLGYRFFLINIQVVVLYQSTNILISNISNPNEVTTYNIAYKLLSSAMMVYTIITAPLWPAYTDAYVKNDFLWMKNMRSKMIKILIASVGLCFMLALCSKSIYSLWINDQVQVPWTMTGFVALYVSVYCWMNLNGTLIIGMGKLKIQTILVTAGMVIHIPLSLFLSRYIGAYGVLVSLIFINMVYAIVLHIQVAKLLNNKASGIWLE